ncbi:hypothetical protein D3C76_1066910 [compost metagenome]
MRSPTNPSNAGNRVKATNTLMRTVAAATNAIVDKKVSPITSIPQRAIITVKPAKNTALPDVPIALAAASCALNP